MIEQLIQKLKFFKVKQNFSGANIKFRQMKGSDEKNVLVQSSTPYIEITR